MNSSIHATSFAFYCWHWCILHTLCLNQAVGSIQWTNTFDIKIYHKNNNKCHFAKYSSLHKAIYQPTSTNLFIFLYHLKIGASWLVNGFVQSGIFFKVAFFIILIIYFNILKSKVLELILPLGSDVVCTLH